MKINCIYVRVLISAHTLRTTLRGVNANVAALAISVLSSSGKKHKLIELPITTAIAIATATTILVKIVIEIVRNRFQDTLQLLMHLTHWEIMRTELKNNE
ncbi:hypothetical protein GQX74_004254 [Glossina fuscipes]|nr:hypothetical protein GQX74_004254 [Glossina fuscipes]